ncbi:MAG: hypothetical protein ABI612_04865 [Betaproteobacteria bacterium]
MELAPRPAYVINGDARWRWQRSIPATKAVRDSSTFRTLLQRNRSGVNG